MEELLAKNPELRAAWELLKPYCVEADCIETNTFQAGEEEAFVKGAKDGMTCWVFSPDFKPYKDE